ILKVRARGVSEAVSAAAIALMKHLFDRSGILAAETQLLPHVFMPIFGQALGRLNAEAVQKEIILILVGLAEDFGGLGGAIADGDQLQTEDVEFSGLLGSEEIRDAQPPPARLPRE